MDPGVETPEINLLIKCSRRCLQRTSVSSGAQTYIRGCLLWSLPEPLIPLALPPPCGILVNSPTIHPAPHSLDSFTLSLFIQPGSRNLLISHPEHLYLSAPLSHCLLLGLGGECHVFDVSDLCSLVSPLSSPHC